MFRKSRLQDVNERSSPQTPELLISDWFGAVRRLPDLSSAVETLCSEDSSIRTNLTLSDTLDRAVRERFKLGADSDRLSGPGPESRSDHSLNGSFDSGLLFRCGVPAGIRLRNSGPGPGPFLSA